MAHQTGAEQLIRAELVDLLSSPDYILGQMTDETANVAGADTYEIGALSSLTVNSDGSTDMEADEPTVSTLSLVVDKEPAILANIGRRKMEQFLKGGSNWELAVAQAAQRTIKNKLDQDLTDYLLSLATGTATTANWTNPASDSVVADDLHDAWASMMGNAGSSGEQLVWVVDSYLKSRMANFPDFIGSNQQMHVMMGLSGDLAAGFLVGSYLGAPVLMSSNLHGSKARGKYTVACTAVSVSSNVATVTATAHGLATGNYVTISGISTELTTAAAITVTDANTFTVALTASNGPMGDGAGTVQLETCVNWLLNRNHIHYAINSMQVRMHDAELNTGTKLIVSPLWGRVGRSGRAIAIGSPFKSQ